MQIDRRKTIASLIALCLILTIAASVVVLPQVNAQTVEEAPVYVYVITSSKVIGVGQQVLIALWTDVISPIADGETQATRGWNNLQVEITKPDDTTETLTIPKGDPIGGGYVLFTPETVGTYSVKSIFPGQWKNTTSSHVYYKPAVSPVETFEVQDEQVQGWVESPLPADYWTRPISTLSRDWYVLASNWLGGAADFSPLGGYGGGTTQYSYGPGPETAHIMWTKPLYEGGIMDARFGNIGYETYHYQGLRFSPLIVNGKINYAPQYSAHSRAGWTTVDLYTGETLFLDYSETMPAYGQVYNYESPNQHGGFAYFWRTSGVSGRLPEIVYIPGEGEVNRTETSVSLGTVWELIDAGTGHTVTYVANVSSSGSAVYGKDGSLLRYRAVNLGTSSNPNYYMTVWNTSAVETFHGNFGSSGTMVWQWRPIGGGGGGSRGQLPTRYDIVHDGNYAFSANFSIPSLLGPRNSISNQTASVRVVREGEYVIVGTTGLNSERGKVPGWLMAFSLEPGDEGRKLWETRFTPPFESDDETNRGTLSFAGVYPEDEVFIFEYPRFLKVFAYDMKSGDLLWESDPEPQGNYYGINNNYIDGKYVTCGYGGVLIAYDIRTGEKLWNYTATTEGFESPYGTYPMNIGAVADGKIYIGTGEHSPTQPIYRGSVLQCINASNGALLWNFPVYGVSMPAGNAGDYFSIADGFLITHNAYDNEIYCFGRGPSATTVTATPAIMVQGSRIVIEGTVTDQSPSGRRNANDGLDFALKGTPAICDEDMNAWMQYLFQQQPFPADAKGVEVTLDTVDPNGNFFHIGTVASDVSGAFRIVYEPDVPGEYQIIATFAGSKSYGPSFANAFVTVEEAPQATPEPTPAPLSAAELYFVPATAGIIVAIAVVGAVLVLLLRKR